MTTPATAGSSSSSGAPRVNCLMAPSYAKRKVIETMTSTTRPGVNWLSRHEDRTSACVEKPGGRHLHVFDVCPDDCHVLVREVRIGHAVGLCCIGRCRCAGATVVGCSDRILVRYPSSRTRRSIASGSHLRSFSSRCAGICGSAGRDGSSRRRSGIMASRPKCRPIGPGRSSPLSMSSSRARSTTPSSTRTIGSRRTMGGSSLGCDRCVASSAIAPPA